MSKEYFPVYNPFEERPQNTAVDGNNKVTEEAETTVSPTLPKFEFPLEKGLIPRNNWVKDIYSKISENDFVNLYGFGGSGKTSLVHLFYAKYAKEFDQIAYVVVNNNPKDDFSQQIYRTIKTVFPKESDESFAADGWDEDSERNDRIEYKDVVECLEKNYSSGKNLFVIDFNTAKDANIFAIGLVKNTVVERISVKGWKYLLVSRECLYDDKSIAQVNLNKLETEDQSKVFLRKLFLKIAGKKYENFGEFDILFKKIHYNPLLTEQLGYYLKDLEPFSYDDIVAILENSDYKDENLHGINRQNRPDEEGTLIGFLKNLVKFNEFNEDEQFIIRHFIIWPAQYIPSDVIIDLLKGQSKSKFNFPQKAHKLIKRGILLRQKLNGEYQYSIHGLMAESIMEQIAIKKCVWKRYLENIKRILGYDDLRFAPYNELIGYSLSKFDIDIKELELSCYYVFKKLSREYRIAIYERAKKKFDKRKGLNEDDLYYKARLWGGYAMSLFVDQTNQHKREEAYKKAIECANELPQNNAEYLYWLVYLYGSVILYHKWIKNCKDSVKKYLDDLIAISELFNDGTELKDYAPFYSFGTKYRIAGLYAGLGEKSSGIEYLSKAVECGKRNPQSCNFDSFGTKFRIAELYAKLGVKSSGIEYLNESVECGKSNPQSCNFNSFETNYRIARLYASLGEKSKGIDYLNEAVECGKNNPKSCNFNSFETNFRIAGLYATLGEKSTGIDYLNKAVECGKNNPQSCNFNSFETNYRIAGLYATLGEKSTGIDYLNKAVEYGKNNPKSCNFNSFETNFRIANLFAEMRDFKNGKQHFEQGINQATEKEKRIEWSQVAEAYHKIAVEQYNQENDFVSAANNLNEEIKILKDKYSGRKNKKVAEAYNLLGFVQYLHYKESKSEADLQSSVEQYKNALEYASGSNFGLLARIYTNYAQACSELGKYKDAVDYFEKVIKYYSQKNNMSCLDYKNQAWAYHNLAYCYREYGQPKNALKRIKSALESIKEAISLVDKEIASSQDCSIPNESLSQQKAQRKSFYIAKLRFQFAQEELKLSNGKNVNERILISIDNEVDKILKDNPDTQSPHHRNAEKLRELLDAFRK